MDAMDSFEPILVDVDCSRYEEDAFSLLDKSRDVNVVRDLRSSTVAAFDQTSFPQLNISSRTQLKQQLYREQTKNSEPARSRSGAVDGFGGPGHVLSVQFPLESIDIELPKKVLQVETRLENPTRYHVIQKQKTQVREYVTAALKLTKQNLVRESCRHTRLMILGRLYDSFISTKPPSGPGASASAVATVASGTTASGATVQSPIGGGSSAGSTASIGSTHIGRVGGALVAAASAATAFTVAMASAATSVNTPSSSSVAAAASTSATPTPIEQQAEWRLEMKLSCRFGNKLYRTFVDEFDYVRDLLGLIRFEIPKWVFVVSEFEDEISSYECNRAARAAQQAAAAAVQSASAAPVPAAADFLGLGLGRPGLLAGGSEKGAKHEKFIEPEVRDRIKKDNHNCSRYRGEWASGIAARMMEDGMCFYY
ncbi:uncharacterized protein LOC125949660 [Anopheles darlingi]|uniref:uncharacterized protein LOC125949660 n=1 Tax=Anopheles darlingi TaxID=43151 RepID=UPI0020FFFA72|nr:uncharacterized protein LOC125949660 [Anopheles darlingi]